MRRAVAAAGIVSTAALLLSAGAAPVAANQGHGSHGYLALGDSVSFGYITQAGYEYGNPANFVGFPTYVGQDLELNTVNAACPGQTTSSFISLVGPDNGCNAFRAAHFPLHTPYTGTQQAFATGFLAANPGTRLVTIQLGANDAFLLQKACSDAPACIAAGLPTLLATVGGNLGAILHSLQATHFKGMVVVLNYYSLDYSDSSQTGLVTLLNQAIGGAAQANGAVVADEFTAFKNAAAAAGGHTCNAGLLNALPQNELTCDVHPSQSGAQLLAHTVEQAYEQADH